MENDKIIEINNKFYQEHSFVMLPSNTRSRLHLVFPGEYEGNGKYTTKDTLLLTDEPSAFGYPAQHLYFLSDEDIKEGDWVINTMHNAEGVSQIGNDITLDYVGIRTDRYKKIIATTDSELWSRTPMETAGIFLNKPLPRPSAPFLEALVKQWNAGNKFDKVLIEYEKWDKAPHFQDLDAKPWHEMKVAPDNTITINPLQ